MEFTNKIVTKGVMYGYVRQQITVPKSDQEPIWHAWTVFIQSSQNQEQSDYVDRVTFALHVDFMDNVRTIFSPPYETTVLGQQECYAYCYVFFKDPTIQPQIFQIKIEFDPGLWY